MKKSMIGLIVMLYVLQIFCVCMVNIEEISGIMSFTIPIIIAIILILMATNGILALKNRNIENESIFKFTMICKCCLVPYYIFNFLFLVFLSLAGILLILLMIVIFAIILLLGIFSYLVVLSTSVYNVVQIGKQKYKFGRNEYVLYTILSLFFVTDVIASILVYQKIKEYKLKQSIVSEGI